MPGEGLLAALELALGAVGAGCILWLARRRGGPKKLPEEAIAALRAVGGRSLIVTPQGELVYLSPAAQDLPVVQDGRLVHPGLAALAEEAWESGETITRPFAPDDLGRLRHIVVRGAVLDQRWVLLTVIDRTEEVQAETARRDLVANLGHELRTPVTAVGLIAQALDSAAADPAAVRRFAHRLTGTAERLERLADDLSWLTLVQDGAFPRSFAAVRVDAVVERAAEQLVEAAARRRVALKFKKHCHAAVWGDFESLVTAVENLLANAIAYSPPGAKVVVTARADAADGEVTVSVIDQGIGIAPEDQRRVFERFYRTDQARQLRPGGTGVGLAVVKRTALAHGGRVALTSGVSLGSTFALTLPLLTAAAAEERAAAERAAAGATGQPDRSGQPGTVGEERTTAAARVAIGPRETAGADPAAGSGLAAGSALEAAGAKEVRHGGTAAG
ncbi:MAG: HAMP domain-containing histidine kinase [Propionibacteriaceae bacterium]|jgi:two-component system sensor histidine kinase SenX3|nr:HAMP domain-containing histidine kinase [Propionibacteriaceae bacterium]